jgi:hypothetical protein
MKDDILIGDTPKAKRRRGRLEGLGARGRLWKHSRLADLDGWLSPDEIAAMRVVTLVRDPWDRMVSYYHWLHEQRFDHPAVARSRAMAFGDFLRHPDTRAEMSHDQVTDYLRLADGRVAGATVLRLESLSTDLPVLERALGLRLEMPRVNESDRPRDIGNLYDDEAKAIVARAYADDIAQFGYSCP